MIYFEAKNKKNKLLNEFFYFFRYKKWKMEIIVYATCYTATDILVI